MFICLLFEQVFNINVPLYNVLIMTLKLVVEYNGIKKILDVDQVTFVGKAIEEKFNVSLTGTSSILLE